METKTPAVAAEQDANPFRYGRRYVKRTLPDGSTDLEQVPLTLEDVLHPLENDEIPVRPQHERDCGYLAWTFRSRSVGPPVVHIAADQSVNWGIEELRDPSPDIAVYVGLREKPNPQK